MQTHRIDYEGIRGPEDWEMAWDDATFLLRDEAGGVVLETKPADVPQLIELDDLYSAGKIVFRSPSGPLTFIPQPESLAAFRELVERGLSDDALFRAALRQHSRRSLVIGVAMFLIAGTLFGLYCWWAVGAPDPPPGHWLRWVGPLIHFVLLVVLAAALAGPYVCWMALRQLRLLRRIEARTEL